jgi:autotransporter-associated beta strand protein
LASDATIFSSTAGNTLSLNANYVGARTLTMGNHTLTIDGPGDVWANANVGVAGDTGGLIKNGTGKLTLYGYNTFYTGATNVNAGSLDLVVGPFTAGWYGINGALTIGTGPADPALAGTVNVNIATNSYPDQISPTSPVTINSDGALNVGAATSLGSLTLNGGRVNITNGVALTPTGSITANTNGAHQTSLISGGQLTLAGSTTINVARDATIASDLTVSSVVGGGALVKQGAGILTLSGANTFTGASTVSAGVLNLQNNSALGTTAGATTVASGAALQMQGGITVIGEALTLNGTGIASDGALRNISGNNTWTGAVTLSSASRINSDAGTLTLSGNIGGAAQNLTFGGAGNTTISSVIGTTTGALTKDGAGTLTLSGNNTYTGGTNINAGTLALGASNALANTTAVSVASGANFNLNGYSDTVGSIAGAGNVTLGAGTLTAGATNTSTTFSGVISGSGALTKSGAGTLTLSGNNTYTGATTVSAGALNIQNNTALGTSAGGTTVTSGAALQMQGGITVTGETLTLNGTGFAGDGALRNISGNNNWTGAITLGSASRINSDAGTLAISGNIGGNTQNLTVGGAGNTTISSVVGTTTGALTKDGAGTLTLSGNNTYAGGTNINAGTLQLGNSERIADNTAVTVASGATLNLNNYTETIGGLSGAGTVQLGTGTLIVGSGNASSTFSGAFASGDTGTFAKTGTGTLTFGSGMNLSTGTLQLGGGILKLGGFTSTFGALSVTADSIIDFGTSGSSILKILNLVTVNSGFTLTIQNWTDTVDYFYSLVNPGATNLGQIVFNGFAAANTKWQSYDHQITPVPETSMYGAALLGLSALFAAWRIHRRRTS